MKRMKRALTLCLISLLISTIIISGIVYGQKSQESSEGLGKYNWYDGDKKEQVFLSPDEVAIFTKNVKDKGNVAKSFDPKATIIKDYEYLMIIQLPQKQTPPGLEDRVIKFNKDTGHNANLVFYRGDQKKEQSIMVPTGEIIVRFKNWDENTVTKWAKDNKIDIIKKFSFSPNTYLLKTGPGFKSIDATNQLYESGNAIYSYPNWWTIKYTRAIPNDLLFKNQWHLLNTGQGGGTSGEDVNIVSVWDTYKGSQNEVIAVVDDGVEIVHEDLSPNILSGYSYDYIDGDSNPTGGAHGTSVAGVAAARGFNLKGVTGAAPEGRLVGHRLLGANTDANEADALTRNGNVIDIYTNSWGPADDRHLEKPGPLTLSALASGISSGRGGKGNIYTWAGGNGNSNTDNLYDDNANYDGYANSRYVFAIAASNNYGTQSWYSEDGANILVNVPSNGGSLGITTTDRTGLIGYSYGSYTYSFGGTSSAAPLAAGITSLILQANPSLSWRDVRLILAQSAEKNNPSDSDWTTNAAGYNINHKYGFGRIDATSAINKAIGWTNIGPEISAEAYKSPNMPIPDNDANGISDTITINQNIKTEFVEIYFTANDHTYWGDLDIELVSPSGTKSKLATKHYISDYGSQRYDNWVFGSVRDIGENSQGTWTLKVKDLWAADTGTLQNWGIKIYGTAISTTPPLSVTVSESPDPVTSGDTSQVTVHVESSQAPVEDASISLSLTGGGTLTPTSGTTGSSGNFVATYTAPSVTSTTTVTISATATKTGYTDGSGSDQITVNPVPSQNKPLYVTISESPDPITSGGTSQVTTHVDRDCGSEPGEVCAAIYPPPLVPAEGVNIILSAGEGTLTPASGITDSNGNFVTTYTAPSVTSTTTVTISATATKTGYTDGSGSDQITVNPSPTPTSNIIISSAMFDAFGTDSIYNINWEWVKIKNTGTTSQSLTGWQLLNKTSAVLYTIPTFTLGAGSTVTVYSGTGRDSGTRLYMNYNRHVWANSGECARLKDNSGNLISEYCT